MPVEAMISYLPRRWESCSEAYWHPRSEWKIVSLLVYGHLRAAISIASHTRGRCRARSPQWRTRPLSSCSSPGAVARQIEHLPGCGCTGGCRPPTCSPGWPAAGARARTRSGREPGPSGPGGRWRRDLSAWPRPDGPRAHGRERTAPWGGASTASANPGGVDPSVPAGWRRSR